MGDVHHGYHARLVIDPVDDPVRATACAEPVIERWQEALADAVGLLQQGAGDELVRRGSHGLGKDLAEGSADCRSGPELVRLIYWRRCHFFRARRRMVSAS